MRGGDWNVRLSKEARGRPSSGWITGDLADISNDLLYESKDSREMLNGSFSLKAHRCRDDDVVERDEVVPQKLFFSVGEGGR